MNGKDVLLAQRHWSISEVLSHNKVSAVLSQAGEHVCIPHSPNVVLRSLTADLKMTS